MDAQRSRADRENGITPRPRIIRMRSERLSVPRHRLSVDVSPVRPMQRSLPRRLSANLPEPLKKRLDAGSSYRVDEQLNTQRYERMMDRFQLRRVASTNSSATTARCDNTTGFFTDPSASSSAAASIKFQMMSRKATKQLEPRKPIVPFSPTGGATQARLVLLTTAILIQAVYLPFRHVYSTTDTDAHVWFDAFVDAVFITNVLAVASTSTFTVSGILLTSRRAIWRQYRRRGLLLDVPAALPIQWVLNGSPSWCHFAICFGHMLWRAWITRRHFNYFHTLWIQTEAGTERSLVSWLMFSRYGHLVRISRIVLAIMLLTHYLACFWASLDGPSASASLADASPTVVHIHSIYDVLQLLQGQGLQTKKVAQDVFASVTVLLGSIALAVVFGHVAILVANFSANDTSYQRKMESVFAVMTKLQLPHPIRERVHQYYEYLHAEYESLDGEVVKFAKDLSHTLELEVVLFKYMDVVMHVPHWRECSPDFQKQLVLHLSVRVYLPDDFIMRRGEVGTECYIINRGTCKLCVYPTGNYEHPTQELPAELDLLSGAISRRSSREAAKSCHDDEGVYSKVSSLNRGQAVGELALIANYERSSDLRAMSYVEMCVIGREQFQRLLVRYPRDRKLVLTNIVRHSVEETEASGTKSKLLKMVRERLPHATMGQGVAILAQAINPSTVDPTLVFGITHRLGTELDRITNFDASPPQRRRRRSATGVMIEGVKPGGSTELRLVLDELQRIREKMGALENGGAAQKLDIAPVKPADVTGGVKAVLRGVLQTKPRLYRRSSESVAVHPRRSSHSHYADLLFQAKSKPA